MTVAGFSCRKARFHVAQVCNDLQLLPSAEHGPKYITLPCVEKPGERL